MRGIALVITFVVGLITPALAQKAEIEAVNAKWAEFFNKGDFAGVASMAEKVGDPKLTTLDVKSLGPSAAREIGTFSLKTKGPSPQEVTGKYVVVWEKVGNDWKLASDIWNDGK